MESGDLALAVGAFAGLITATGHAFVTVSRELRAWRVLESRDTPAIGPSTKKAAKSNKRRTTAL
jgi:hypothetical protein